MTVFPIQTAACTGCMVCTMECPTDIITIDKVEGEVRFAPPQGPLVPEPGLKLDQWQALSTHSHVAHVPADGRPVGIRSQVAPVRRFANWRVGVPGAPGRISRRVRRRSSGAQRSKQ